MVYTYLDYPTCGDALVYEAINYYVQGYPFEWCKGLYMEAYNMFDGKGVEDSHFSNTNQYDNMKLALLIFGAKVLNLSVNLNGIEQQLWNAQKTSGVEVCGITSVTDISGQPVGTANGETTAFTLLAYDNALIEQMARSQQLLKPKYSINVTFPVTCFNQTSSITANITAIPLFENWKVAFNNTIQWGSPQDNPCVVTGFFSSLASPKNLSIQIVEYYNNVSDVIIHDASNPNGSKITSMSWSNPLTISLVSNTLTVSSPAGTYAGSFPSFRLAYITAGSTESRICYGGEVENEVIPEFPPDLTLPLFMIATLLAIIVYGRKHPNNYYIET